MLAIVETSSFRIVLPDSWVLREATPHALIEGPKSERLEISSFAAAGSGTSGQLEEVRSSLRQNILTTFTQMTCDGSCEARTELQKHDSPGSEEFYQQIFQSADGETGIGVFGLLNGECAVIASVEAPATDPYTMLEVAQWLDGIVWFGTRDGRSEAPWWKLWAK